jgi:hypothetical protein
MRTPRKTLTFDQPFTLSGVDQQQPAGTYAVDTDEELLEGLSFVAYRRVATVIYVPLPHSPLGSLQAVSVDPQELDAVPRR